MQAPGTTSTPWVLWVYVRRGRFWELWPDHDFLSPGHDPFGAAPNPPLQSPSKSSYFYTAQEENCIAGLS